MQHSSGCTDPATCPLPVCRTVWCSVTFCLWEHHLVKGSQHMNYLCIPQELTGLESATSQHLGANQKPKQSPTFIYWAFTQPGESIKKTFLFTNHSLAKDESWPVGGVLVKHSSPLSVCAANWSSHQSFSRDINPLIVPEKWHDSSLAH